MRINKHISSITQASEVTMADDVTKFDMKVHSSGLTMMNSVYYRDLASTIVGRTRDVIQPTLLEHRIVPSKMNELVRSNTIVPPNTFDLGYVMNVHMRPSTGKVYFPRDAWYSNTNFPGDIVRTNRIDNWLVAQVSMDSPIEIVPSQRFMSQLYNRLSVPSGVEKHFGEAAAALLANTKLRGTEINDETHHLVRVREQGGVFIGRAFLSEDYSILNNSELLQELFLRNMFDTLTPVHFDYEQDECMSLTLATQNTLTLEASTYDSERADMTVRVGITIVNSETGQSSAIVYPTLLVSQFTHLREKIYSPLSIIVSVDYARTRIKHIHKSKYQMINELEQSIQSSIEIGHFATDRLRLLHNQLVRDEKMNEFLERLAKKYKLTIQERDYLEEKVSAQPTHTALSVSIALAMCAYNSERQLRKEELAKISGDVMMDTSFNDLFVPLDM